jgi:membrane fusion protein, multidrug efflux system
MKNLIIGVIILLLFGLGIWKLGNNKKVAAAEAKLAQVVNTVIPVTVSKVENTQFSGGYQSQGSFTPYKQISVLSDGNGKITSLSFENGTQVSEGKTLLTLDTDLIKIDKENAQRNLAKAENDLKRLQNLLNDGGVTQQQIDDVKIQLENLRSKISMNDKQLSLASIKAPISGVISGKSVERGSYLAPGMRIADITNISKLKLAVYLTEQQVVDAKVGQKINIIADLFPNKTLTGTISFIDVKADPSKRFLTEIEVNNNGLLKAGMSATAKFGGAKSRSVNAIPRECIDGSISDGVIYVVEGNVVKKKQATFGSIFEDKVEVLNGLSLGEVVVKTGQINLKDGFKVEIRNNN